LALTTNDSKELGQENGASARDGCTNGCAHFREGEQMTSNKTSVASTIGDDALDALIGQIAERWMGLPENLRPMVSAQILAVMQAVTRLP
jgi:hypothetical protein